MKIELTEAVCKSLLLHVTNCFFHPLAWFQIEAMKYLHADLQSIGLWIQIPLALLKGRVTNVIWPPSRFGHVENRLPEGRVLSQNRGTSTYS